jgi:NDP-mannose synthase
MKNIKQAVIIVGGEGVRLRPYTVVLPKPLMPIGDYTILEVLILQLKRFKFEEIFLATGYKSALIKSYFGDGKNYGLKINYINEKKPLGTIGPIKSINGLKNHFLVMNGDILTNINFSKFLDNHIKSKSNFTIASFNRSHQIEFGVIEKKNDKLKNFIEKPKKTFEICMGIYAANKNIIQIIPKNKFYGLDHLVKDMLNKDHSINVHNHKGLWFDIGRPVDYHKVVDYFKNNKKKFL